MKKYFATVIVIIFLFSAAFAQKNEASSSYPISLSVQTFAGITFGNYGEYVFSWNDDYVRSYLQWNVKPLLIGGMGVGFGYKNFETDFSASFGLPIKCGKMYDSDWNGDGVKTTYSINENNAILNFDLELLLKYNFPIGLFKLSPSLQFEYLYNSFQSKNGYGWYGSSSYNTSGKDEDFSWDSEYARRFKVSRIELTRWDFYTFLGVDFFAKLSERFSVFASTYFAPYVYCYYSDYHRDDAGKGRGFYLTAGQTNYFLRFKQNLCVQFAFAKSWNLNLNASLLLGPVIKGQLQGYEQNGGSDIKTIKITFGVEKLFLP